MNSEPSPSRGSRDPSEFVVTGGEAFRVDTEALGALAGALAAVASAAESVAGHLEAARSAVWRGACAGSGAAASCDAEAARLVAEAAQAALEAQGSARGIALSAAGYAATEARTAASAGSHQLAMRHLVWGSVPPLVGWAVAAARSSPVGLAAGGLRLLAGGAAALPPLVPWVPSGRPDDPISVVRSTVAPGAEDASTFAYAATSLQQAQGGATLDDGGTVPASSILVERIPRPDGSTAVMVTVPGTQTWAPDDWRGGVFDAEGNLDAMAGRDSHVRQLIERALADQRLRAGDSVVFNAYSQGSLHVFGLLEDQSFRSRYPVAAVTVLGGVPTAFRVPDDVAVLSLANRDDVVPGLSGLPPVPRPNVVDVRTPSHAGMGQGLLADVGLAHDLGRYAGDASALDRSGDPSVRGYAAVLGAAVGTGVVGAVAAGIPSAGTAPRPVPRRERFVYTGTDTVTPVSSSGSRRPSP